MATQRPSRGRAGEPRRLHAAGRAGRHEAWRRSGRLRAGEHGEARQGGTQARRRLTRQAAEHGGEVVASRCKGEEGMRWGWARMGVVGFLETGEIPACEQDG